jgi:putative CocE/NonD family hydrolase
LHFGGWYDTFTRGTISVWDGISRNSDNIAARSMQWLVMGPWDHNALSWHLSGSRPPTNIGRRQVGVAAVTTYEETLLEFFNYFLKGDQNGFIDKPRVRYFSIGDNAWRDSDQWPPRDMETRALYFQSEGDAASKEGGTLDAERPTAEGADSFVYDPRAPVDITANTDVWGRAADLPDRSALPERPDVLTYQTSPLTERVDITGPITVLLYAASSAPDTDFTAALVDVYPDGYSLLIQEGILRASFRNRASEPTLIEPNRIYRYAIDLWATSYTVAPGHRLRVEISSSNFPRYARNLNNGEAPGTSDRMERATQVIYHGGDHPSQLLLPVVPAPQTRSRVDR